MAISGESPALTRDQLVSAIQDSLEGRSRRGVGWQLFDDGLQAERQALDILQQAILREGEAVPEVGEAMFGPGLQPLRLQS